MDRQDMNKIKTVNELDCWAKRHGLSIENDTDYSLRRLQIMADTISKALPFSCEACGVQFKQKSHFLRHQRTMHGNNDDAICPHCQKKFKRHDNLKRHLQQHTENIAPSTKPQNEQVQQRKRKLSSENEELLSTESKLKRTENIEKPCNWCSRKKVLLPGKPFCEPCGNQGRECKWCHRPLPERFYGKRTDVCDSCVSRKEKSSRRKQQWGGRTTALNNTAETQILHSSGNIFDVLQFFKDNEDTISYMLESRFQSMKGMKWFMTLFVKFVKYDQNNDPIYAEPVFRSSTFGMTNMSQIEQQIAGAFQDLHNGYQNFERDGSGWSIDKIIKLEINTAEYLPLEGSSYLPLPKEIQDKKAVLNIQNDDQKCFIWSILAALHPIARTDHPNRVHHYVQYQKQIDTSEIEFPVPISQISRFEKQNNISVNVFGLEHNEIFPLQITDQRNMPNHVNLLLFSRGDVRHYCLIKNLSRLLGDRTAHDGQTYYCNYCLHGFTTSSLLSEHVPYCSPHGAQKVSFPKSEDKQWVQFTSIHKQLKVPFVIYADFERFVRPIDSCTPNPATSSTTLYQKHEACGYSFLVKCAHDEMSKPVEVYRGPNVIDNFFDRLLQEENEICELLKKVKPMKLTSFQERSFQTAQNCHICEEPLDDDRVRDHDHLSGDYRGAAHRDCNLQYQFRQGKNTHSFYIPVIFHNLKGYDMHHLMSAAGKYKDRNISCIPNNMEKYISFSMGNLRFIDSLQFLNASLDTLVSNLAKEGQRKFSTITKHFPDPLHQTILLRKGVFPYDFLTSPDCFQQTCLPTKEHFYNKLNENEIGFEDYEHAKNVWQIFNMRTFGEYHDLYLKTDVLLLADVFENFRALCLDSYHLDPAHYYTSPGLAWDAMLRMTGVELQLLDDINMVLMIEKGIRGGVSMICKKYAKANNPKLPDYDPSQPKKYISYLDKNNLYASPMSDPLPKEDFAWLSEEQIESLDISNISDNAQTGYILEVDLDYPYSLHDQDSDLPMAPETMTITNDMLSPHSLMLRKRLGLKGKPYKKLVPNLRSKTKYVVHYRNLKYYLAHGLKLTKIHRVLAFTQSAWLKPYIDFNTQKRKMAMTTFDKDFYKLMNNAVFGKTMENMRKRINVELVNTSKRLRKVSAKPNFQAFKIFNDDLVAVNMRKTYIVLNRPIYAGFCILDLSKIYMYQFHYGFMKEKYGDRAKLLFTDTDSLTYEIQTEDWYADMLENSDLFDTSNFPKDSPLYSQKNCKVLGKMKDECGGTPIVSFVGLQPKMYSLKYGDQQKQTAKGVKKCVIEKQLKHEAYEQCLFDYNTMHHTMNMIRSYNHQLYSVTVSKTTLSPYDTKRYVLDSGIDTLAHGHYKIKS